MKSGDAILCYVQGDKRWVGMLEVLSPAYRDSSAEFERTLWAVRCRVRPMVILDVDRGVPVATLSGLLSYYRDGSLPWRLVPFFRPMLARFDEQDGRLIEKRLQEAAENVEAHQPHSYAPDVRIPVYESKSSDDIVGTDALVTIPESHEPMTNENDTPNHHAEMQWQLLQIGAQFDQQTWIPHADRQRAVNGMALGEAPNLLTHLPALSNVSVALYRTIEKFDCLWIRDNMIVAAFEVEHTPVVQNGLLRMQDLINLSPRNNIALYLVAPDEHYERFAREIVRPSFSRAEVPLHSVCGFLPHRALLDKIRNLDAVSPLRLNEMLDEVAKYYDPADDTGV